MDGATHVPAGILHVSCKEDPGVDFFFFFVEFPKILGFLGSLDGAGVGPCSRVSRHGPRAERSCL